MAHAFAFSSHRETLAAFPVALAVRAAVQEVFPSRAVASVALDVAVGPSLPEAFVPEEASHALLRVVEVLLPVPFVQRVWKAASVEAHPRIAPGFWIHRAAFFHQVLPAFLSMVSQREVRAE